MFLELKHLMGEIEQLRFTDKIPLLLENLKNTLMEIQDLKVVEIAIVKEYLLGLKKNIKIYIQCTPVEQKYQNHFMFIKTL